METINPLLLEKWRLSRLHDYIAIWLKTEHSRRRAWNACVTFVSRANSSNCKHNLDSTRPEFFFIGKREPAFFVSMLLVINLLEDMLLFLRNFVSVCSQKLPKCNKPDNRHAASKFHNFTTTTNLTLVSVNEKCRTWFVWTPQNPPTLRNGVCLFVCLFVC